MQHGVHRAPRAGRGDAEHVQEGKAYDNAKMESFYKTLKYEEVNLQDYQDLADARREIGVFIEERYNRQRLHSSLGYVPPAEFAARYTSP